MTAAIAVNAPVRNERRAARWSVPRDIRWGAIDRRRARADRDTLDAVRGIALAFSARPVPLAALALAAWDDPRATAVLTAGAHEAMKNFHALRTYLDVVEHAPAIADAEIVEARRALAERAPRPEEVVTRLGDLVIAHRTAAAACDRLARECAEPVLAKLLCLIADDEERTAATVYELMSAR